MKILKCISCMFTVPTALFFFNISVIAADTDALVLTENGSTGTVYKVPESTESRTKNETGGHHAVKKIESPSELADRSKAPAARMALTDDKDGFLNRCKKRYFGDLDEKPDADSDQDGLTNLQECSLGTDPTLASKDHDADGLPDVWEAENFGDIDHNCDTDANGDGVYDCIEYELGRDPNATQSRGPGVHYEYDALGRITKIHRIPSK